VAPAPESSPSSLASTATPVSNKTIKRLPGHRTNILRWHPRTGSPIVARSHSRRTLVPLFVQSFQRIHSSRSAVLSTLRLLVPFRENFTSYRTQLRGRIWAYIISRQIRRAIGIKPERRFNLGLPFGAVGRTNTGLRGSGKSVEVEAEHRHQQLPPWSQTATWEGYSFSHEALQHTSTKMRPYQYTSPPTTSTNSGFEYSPYGTGTPLPQPQRERGARRKKNRRRSGQRLPRGCSRRIRAQRAVLQQPSGGRSSTGYRGDGEGDTLIACVRTRGGSRGRRVAYPLDTELLSPC